MKTSSIKNMNKVKNNKRMINMYLNMNSILSKKLISFSLISDML